MGEQQPNEERMYDDQIAGNPRVNETQVRRAGRLIDDRAAADALQSGDLAGAGSVQGGQTAADRGDEPDPTDGRKTASARNAEDAASRSGQTQNRRLGQE